jgi:hypothetical protein
MCVCVCVCVCVLYIKCFDKIKNYGVINPHPKRKSSYQRESTAFQKESQPVAFSLLDFYMWRHLKAFLYSALYKNEDKLQQHIFMSVKPFATTLGSLKVCNSPWSDMFKSALIQLEDILSICSEMILEKQ